MRLSRLFLFFIGCSLFGLQSINATHIKAADLYAQVNPFNLQTNNAHRNILYTLNLYCDKKSVNDGQSNDICAGLGNCASMDFGDGNVARDVRYVSREDVGNNTYLIIFQFYHTYGADKFYEAGYFEENRNNGILNLTTPSNSLAFYIKMGITIESGFGSNQTPQMDIPPVDLAAVNRIFIHNPGASDINGDSISYKLYQPQIAPGQFDGKYVNPNHPRFGGRTQDLLSEATFKIYNTSEDGRKPGDVVWNSPGTKGLYNIAILIEEWRIIGRIRQRISYSIRDMQIDVKESQNRPPVIILRSDSCISPGMQYKSPIQVTDQDFMETITLTPYGELFQSVASGGSVSPVGKNVPVTFNTEFSWTPTCNNVRKRPYQVFFKATDNNSTPLTDIKSFNLTVVGPRPKGLIVDQDSLSSDITLKWNKYECSGAARYMEIYKRVGCDTVKVKNCVLGKPSPEYVLIGTTKNINDTTFTDSTAKRGNVYSYSIAALFQDNFRINSNSYPSANVCVELPLIAPIITKVSFEEAKKNRILISWKKPVDIDTSKITGPYQYELYKKKVGEAQYQLLQAFGDTGVLVDGSFTDSIISSKTDYLYYVKLNYFTKAGVIKSVADSTEISSSVSLTTTSISGGVRLQWKANTPWQNGVNGLYHYIWVKGPNDIGFTKIDSVTFNQGTQVYHYDDYRNRGGDLSKLCDTLTYFVTTAGSYKNPKIKPDTIYNNSFLAKGTILNDKAPKSPVLEQYTYDCSTFNQTYPFKNALSWNKITSAIPCFKIVGYNIYFSSKSSDENMSLVARVDTSDKPSFTHINLKSVAGCYSVTSFDNLGNESVKSEKLCLTNCSLFDLPNVFTPNGSGINDLFIPIPPSPRFVESVKFAVFNRWGTKVFEKSDDVNLNWDGSGLPDGVYFYTAKVKFISPEEDNSTKDLKGWIQIIR